MNAWHRDPQASDLGREVERLRRELADREEQIRRQAEQITEQKQQIADAEKQIADLERHLALRKQNSTNSSKPPSSDGLAGEPQERGRCKKSRRKAGGQPGRRGAHRPLVAAQRVDEIRPVLPEQCRHCGHSLSSEIEQVRTTGEPQRHQVTELPPI
jgi:transposase